MTAEQQKDPSVLRMAGPLVISFWMRSAFTFVDTAYAATIGDDAVAAIGLAVPFEFIMISLWVGLSTGFTSAFSRALGADDAVKIAQYKARILRIIMVVNPLFGLIGVGIWFWAPHMGLTPEVERAFQVYGTVLILGSAVTGFWSIIPDSIVKAYQDTKATMWAGIASNIINVILNTVFLFVFDWGVFGIALSTVLGRLGGLVYALGKAAGHERAWAATSKGGGEADPRPTWSILRLSLPASLAFLLMAGETGLINFILAGFENATEAIAAYSIYYRVTLFFINPVVAIGVALLPFIAKRFGRGDFADLRLGFRQACLASLAYCVLFVTPLIAFGAAPLSEWLAESEMTARFATISLYFVPAGCLVGALFLLCRPVFEGMGQARPVVFAAVGRYILLTAPGAYLGVVAARAYEQPEIYGLIAGLLIVALISSGGFFLWLLRSLPQEDEVAFEGDSSPQAGLT